MKNELKNLNLISFRQLIYLAIGAFGLQFISTVEMNNTSGIFKFLGASDHNIGMLWLIAPLAGLIVQPLLGQISDLSMTRYGKRTPYIVTCSIISALALLVVIFSHELWLSVLMMLFLGCGINGATEALRSLIGDITSGTQRSTAFALQAIFSGAAAMLASIIPAFLSSAHFFGPTHSGAIPASLKVSLVLGGYILIHSIWMVVNKIKEREIINKKNLTAKELDSAKFNLNFIFKIWTNLFANIFHLPDVIKKFFLVQLFTWSGMFCIWLYFGIALSQHIFHLPIRADISNNIHDRQIFENGLAKMGVCFAIYQALSVLYVMILPKLVQQFSPRKIHALSLIIGAFSLIALVFTTNIYMVYFLMLGFGICWGSIVTLPYIIVTAEIPPNKMGTYLGIFNITITIPQIICGLLVGYINEFIFFNHAIFTILLGAIFILSAGLILLKQTGYDIVEAFKLWLTKLLFLPQ